MNMQPSEAEAGFDIHIPPTEDPDLLKKRIDEEWAPATRNLTYQLIQQGSVMDITGCPLITTTDDSNSWWSTFKEVVIASGGKLQKPKILRSTTDARFMRQLGIPTLGFSNIGVLAIGEIWTFTARAFSSPVPDHTIIVNYDGFAEDVKVGDDLLVDGGMANLTFWRDGSLVQEHKAMLPTISPKDWLNIDFGIAEGVDFIAVSFVKSAEIINHLKFYIAARCRDSDISVTTKIESIDSLKNLEEIIQASDGAMIARGDLGAQPHRFSYPNP
ncbi:uncharacterized protein A4U43_C05F13500 [Asparagus officinalis]|uniref:Pyruvate kinase n=1 Tax=Asparagus officinalis TaxID=4686 RepID=A0A5P1ERD1_ASPOF|nr:pyruvate kinase isozyme A, chloroplastic-like [Asparagus officinalis]ONK68575.1 uncharacterized protein A4U43_C05F13500 [Asparagus officinalis]